MMKFNGAQRVGGKSTNLSNSQVQNLQHNLLKKKKLTFLALQYSLISLKKLLDSVYKIVDKLQVAVNRLLISVKLVQTALIELIEFS